MDRGWLTKRIAGGALIFVFALAVTQPAGAQQSTRDRISSILLPLVGQKCKIHFKSGEVKRGTLWDFDEEQVVVKIKKGLLYSKAERFKLQDIEYVEDSDHIQYHIAAVLNRRGAEATSQHAVASSERTPTPAETGEDLESGLQIIMRPATEKPEAQTETASPEPKPSRAEVETESTETAAPAKQVAAVPPPKAPEKPQVAKPVVRRPRVKKPRVSKRTLVRGKSRKRAPQVTTPKAEKPKTDHAATSTSPLLAASVQRKLRILRYQTYILFGVSGLVIALTLLLKLLGIKNSAYAKQSLFPTKLLKMSGRYGIIDQGANGGVRTDDVIRIYRKTGRKVEFRGTAKVRKVGENYSAVELVRHKRDTLPEVGDIGFRDRNHLLGLLKGLRTLASAALGGLAKILAFTAKNLEVKDDEPAIDLRPRIVESVRVTEVVEQDLKKSKRPRSAKKADKIDPFALHHEESHHS
ncbi:MAG: hypothetical protein D6743_08105 [Calditrichaeota bacterium]|nr:MAG: hypothetical protein D6743_08105 [Calditrichota bacterium]